MLFRLLNVIRVDAIGRIMITLACAGARNKTASERLARVIVGLVFTVPAKDNFMADKMVDDDRGFDLEALRRYQRGKGT